MLFGGVAVLVVAFALHVSWVSRLARERGRSVIVWILAVLMAAAVGLSIGVVVVEATADAESAFAGSSVQSREGRIRQSELLAKLLAPQGMLER